MVRVRVYRRVSSDDWDHRHLVAEIDMPDFPEDEDEFAQDHGGDEIEVLYGEDLDDIELMEE